MPPDIDSGAPSWSVGNAATSRMHPAHIPTGRATRRPAPIRASTSASMAAPRAIAASETGSSQPCGV